MVNEGTSRPLYRIETPRKVARKTTRIYRVLPINDLEPLISSSSNDHSSAESPSPSIEGEEQLETDASMDQGEMARIHWHHFSPDRVVFDGRLLKRSQLLPRSGTLVFMSRHDFWSDLNHRGYTFKVGDVELKWKLGFFGMSLPKVRASAYRIAVIALIVAFPVGPQ